MNERTRLTRLATKILVDALRATVGFSRATHLLTTTRDVDGVSVSELLTTGRYHEAEALLRPILFAGEQHVQHPRMVRWRDDE